LSQRKFCLTGTGVGVFITSEEVEPFAINVVELLGWLSLSEPFIVAMIFENPVGAIISFTVTTGEGVLIVIKETVNEKTILNNKKNL
jgi:hypothetical protein